MRTMQSCLFAGLLAGAAMSALASDLADVTYRRYVAADGEIRLPKDFRASWTHLGSWAVADPDAPGHGFHDVYTQPEAAAAYHASGTFPDGAVLVKEIRTLRSAAMTTGHAAWAGEPAVWFVMVRDARNRHQGAHWAEGWGWALFEAADPERNVSAGFAGSCQGCHLPARDRDWVFVEGYPKPVR